jgi:hypothetical protein
LTAGNTFLGRAIRWGQRTRGEEPSVVNHAAIVVAPGDIFSAIIVESDLKVRRVPIGQHHAKDLVIVFRLPLSQAQMDQIVAGAEAQIGKRYGYLQIVAQLIDHKLFGGKVRARRLLKASPRDICSRLVAEQLDNAGWDLGVEPYAATPDDLHDVLVVHPDAELVAVHVGS